MIELKNIYKKVNGRTILNNVNITINKGELVTLIGPSGCGKTTTLKMINRLITQTSGEILIDGNKIEKENTIKLRRNIGYVIQQTGLFPHLTVEENIGMIMNIEKIDKDKISRKVEELLNLVGLDPESYRYKYPTELSGGQQQRIGIARALAMDPEVILMDEPFSALDPITRNQLQDEIFSIHQNLKKTIVFVTHDMDEALKLADRICIMKDGEVIQYDTPDKILRKPKDDFVKTFVGENMIWNQPDLIKVKDIMIKTVVKSSPERTSIQALEIMKSNHVDRLIITSKDNKLLGVVTLKELKVSINENKKLKDIMSNNLITINESDSIIKVLEIVENKKIGFMPVLDNEANLVGLITKSSLLSVLSNQFINKEVDLYE
ncbi:ABC transporter ATP-binding protein [Clostridium felsineum]|uniref:Quaternary amine transport ATP-binding protein n=1 Tax=Clostridium felsineum TaxID=36839 RepID=A0A1S8M7N2_9CLOT|nr:ABC transporter ATP-binding protein [Clostridium felsineum]URZ07930.1 Glycine betaine/carnitine/choline transport ATP-binding protein OpuCA [Clostridium felsineum]URZ12961.1 Glycine betaine/carnitine/choline transport ATP-binding protein OpuCA [Clostridium felsineum]